MHLLQLQRHFPNLPSDAIHKRGLYAVVRCTAAGGNSCQSATFVYSMKTAKYILKFFSHSGSHATLVFPSEILWQTSDAVSLTWRRMQVGMNKYFVLPRKRDSNRSLRRVER